MFADLDDLDPDDVDDDLVRVMADGKQAMPRDDFDFEDPASPYEMACEALDEGTVADGPAGALVIGEEVTVATFVPDEHGGMFIGVVWGDPQEHEHALKQPMALDWAPVMHWELSADDAVLLNATDIDDPEWLEDTDGSRLELSLAAGMYDVWLAAWEPDDETRFQLVRLVRLPEE